jgi:hypothetical protein
MIWLRQLDHEMCISMYNLLMPTTKTYIFSRLSEWIFDPKRSFKTSCHIWQRILIFHREKVRIRRIILKCVITTRRAWFIGFSFSGVDVRAFIFILKWTRICTTLFPFVCRWIRCLPLGDLQLQISILRYGRRLYTAILMRMSFGEFHKSIGDWWMAGGGERCS